jgi:hypothetical protein
MITIRKDQMRIFADLVMFEQRILCHKLPESFNIIKININSEEHVNKRNKIIKEFKRQMLNNELEQYETKIQHYEDLYHQTLHTFQSQILHTHTNHNKDQLDALMHSIALYLNHHIHSWMREIRFKESRVHFKLLHHHNRRQKLSKPNTKNDVYPLIIVDIPKISLNRIQLNFLSRNGKLERFY